MFHRPSGFLAACLCALALSACSTVQEERSLGRELDDNNASWSIKSAMLRAEGYALDGVDVEVAEGVALLTGHVPREDDSQMAECLAWSSVAVRSVTNELIVGDDSGFGDGTRDLLISQRIRARLLTDRSIRSVNFNVEAFNGRVFLLGLARSRGELERATAHASLVEGVTEVVSLVRVAGVPSNLPARGERRAAACGGEPVPALELSEDDTNSGPQLLGAPETTR